MKSVAGLGLGVIALTAGAFISAGEAAGHGTILGSLARGSYFEAAVKGAAAARPSGDVAFGIVGDSAAGVAAFTITLGAGDSSGAILFTNLDGGIPAPGRYDLNGESRFRATYVAGSPERPAGLFRAERGTLEITASSADHISGHFSFTGTGFLASDMVDEDRQVTVNGAFTSTHDVPAPRPAQP